MSAQSSKELETMLEEFGDKIAEHFYQSIQILGAIVSAQDQYFEGSHCRFVSQKSAEVAQALGMSETEVF